MLSDPDFRELVMLPLPTSVLRELSRAGYSNVGEISGLTIEQIESVCKIPKPRAASIAAIIQEHASLRKDSVFTTNFPNKNLFYPHSALQMLHPSLSNLVIPSEFRVANVLTMSKSFDDLMGGGFPCGRITELCGQPGVGKTQFCLQTCLTVQIPQWCGGLAGEAIFLDTEGSFIPKRLHQMAVELVKHCQTMLAPCLQQYMEGLDDSYADAEEKVACLEALSGIPTEESLLSKVHYIRCTGYLQLLAAVQRLGEFCKYHPNIRLIIVDSIALPFRYEFEDIPQRNRLLAAVAQSLLSTASAQNAAVIMTNQITTKFVTSETSATTRSTLVPALGESWGHICSVRLLLSKAEGSDAEQRRTVRLLKHPGRPPGTAAYQVTAGGIRDCF
ncbi:DNA repair protein RAD51 3 [Echinococcus multilocularis]|uniref:DNA repair protein RAD51 homolog 3 n=1 Tax=Echinococcus multilocularis TaxID=6211 RepID=A0A068YEF3_ECHMU|nr:DNA repair protein RAD51 3 [Echinococcus multilocularis]